MEYPKELFEKLSKELRSMAISPEIDLVICFPGIDEEDCEEESEIRSCLASDKIPYGRTAVF